MNNNISFENILKEYEEALEQGLEVEVIYDALKLMREDDSLSPAQAFQEAINEWVK